MIFQNSQPPKQRGSRYEALDRTMTIYTIKVCFQIHVIFPSSPYVIIKDQLLPSSSI